MSKSIATMALAAAMAVATIIPAATPVQADSGRHHYGRQAYGGHHHRGHRGSNGKWIALGIIGAAVGAAVADSEYRDCYYRQGRRYCNY